MQRLTVCSDLRGLTVSFQILSDSLLSRTADSFYVPHVHTLFLLFQKAQTCFLYEEPQAYFPGSMCHLLPPLFFWVPLLHSPPFLPLQGENSLRLIKTLWVLYVIISTKLEKNYSSHFLFIYSGIIFFILPAKSREFFFSLLLLGTLCLSIFKIYLFFKVWLEKKKWSILLIVLLYWLYVEMIMI